MTLEYYQIIFITISFLCIVAIVFISCMCKKKTCYTKYPTTLPIVDDGMVDDGMVDGMVDDGMVDENQPDEPLQRRRHRNSQPQFRGRVGNHGDFCKNGHWCKPISGTNHSVCRNNKCSQGYNNSSCGVDADCRSGLCIKGKCTTSQGRGGQPCKIPTLYCKNRLHKCWGNRCMLIPHGNGYLVDR